MYYLLSIIQQSALAHKNSTPFRRGSMSRPVREQCQQRYFPETDTEITEAEAQGVLQPCVLQQACSEVMD